LEYKLLRAGIPSRLGLGLIEKFGIGIDKFDMKLELTKWN